MFEDAIKELDKIETLFKYVSSARFEIGIFSEDGSKKEQIMVLNLDGTKSYEEMTLSEIMYLTEKGTLTIPPKPIFRHIVMQLNHDFPYIINEIFDGIRTKNWKKQDVRGRLVLVNQKINDYYIPNAINAVLASDNVISGLLNAEEDQNYTFDLKKLKKFIKSKIFFSN